MTRHTYALWIRGLCASLLMVVCAFPSPAHAEEDPLRPPWTFLKEQRADILKLASDEEALTLFRSTMTPQSRAVRNRATPPAPGSRLTEEIQPTVISLMASLAVIAHAQQIRDHVIDGSPDHPSLPQAAVPGDVQLQWMKQHLPLQSLNAVFDGFAQVADRLTGTFEPVPSDQILADLASHFDHLNPLSNHPSSSWLSIFDEQGFTGVDRKLTEFWETPAYQSTHQAVSASMRSAYAEQYVRTRLLPILQAHLLARLIQLEAEAYDVSVEKWTHLQKWKEREQTQRAATRLCGTWRWIVHNHQNHGDHKTMLTFAPPGEASPSHPQPSIISIQGDTVYLQWTFPQGIQEDSLLLSNQDSHLEGTFKNSLGPHGSISGKRLSPCPS